MEANKVSTSRAEVNISVVDFQEVYLRSIEGDITEKVLVNIKNPTNNCKVVRVKANRTCKECGGTIFTGSECYTFNPKGMGRSWVCFSCLPEPNKVRTTKVGERGIYYSDDRNKYGFAKSLNQLGVFEEDFFNGRVEQKIEEEVSLNEF